MNSINSIELAMCMAMNMMRPGLFFQREGPGSEPGNSLLCPDEAPHAVFCVPCLRDSSVSSELIA